MLFVRYEFMMLPLLSVTVNETGIDSAFTGVMKLHMQNIKDSTIKHIFFIESSPSHNKTQYILGSSSTLVGDRNDE
jgi:hypothetical protein